jgi:hypothetical protein
MVCYTLDPRVFLYDTYVKYRSAGKCQWKFWYKFHDGRVLSRQIIHNLVNKLRTVRLLIYKKTKYKRWVLTVEKLDDLGARLEHTPRKSLKSLAQETGVSKYSWRTATQLLKFRPFKTTAIHTLQPHDSASRICFWSGFLQSVVEGEVDLQLTFFSDEAWFHLQKYINTQNNHYWSSQNPLLTMKPCSNEWKLVSGVL